MPISGVHRLNFVRVNATSIGDNIVVAAVAEKSILVVGYVVATGGANTVTFQDSAATPVVHAAFPLAANGGVAFRGSPESPAFQLGKGVGLEINNSAAVTTSGHLTYLLV